VGWKHCFNDSCKEHRWKKVDHGYYPRNFGEAAPLSAQDEEHRKRRKTVRIRHGREESEETIPDVEALKRQISDLRGQLDRAAHIIVAKDNMLEALDKKNDELGQTLNKLKLKMRKIGAELWRGGA
jgi:chromosome segregation ATPase